MHSSWKTESHVVTPLSDMTALPLSKWLYNVRLYVRRGKQGSSSSEHHKEIICPALSEQKNVSLLQVILFPELSVAYFLRPIFFLWSKTLCQKRRKRVVKLIEERFSADRWRDERQESGVTGKSEGIHEVRSRVLLFPQWPHVPAVTPRPSSQTNPS